MVVREKFESPAVQLVLTKMERSNALGFGVSNHLDNGKDLKSSLLNFPSIVEVRQNVAPRKFYDKEASQSLLS